VRKVTHVLALLGLCSRYTGKPVLNSRDVMCTLKLSCTCFAGSTQQHWPFPEHRIPLGYAYLFTHPGNPSIFWDHYFTSDCRDVIDNLIALRKRSGINAKSSVEILAADHDFYVARIDDK